MYPKLITKPEEKADSLLLFLAPVTVLKKSIFSTCLFVDVTKQLGTRACATAGLNQAVLRFGEVACGHMTSKHDKPLTDFTTMYMIAHAGLQSTMYYM